MDTLTAKQNRFVEQYLIDLNATAAAIRAGYSKHTANAAGPRLLANPIVAAAIDAAKLERSARTQIDAEWVLRRLVAEAEADIAELYDDNGDLLPVEDWPLPFRQGLVTSVDIEERFEGEGEDSKAKFRVTKIRLSDRLRRIELIGKHVTVQAFQETIQHKGLDGLADRLERADARAHGRGDVVDAEFSPVSDDDPEPSLWGEIARIVAQTLETTTPEGPDTECHDGMTVERLPTLGERAAQYRPFLPLSAPEFPTFSPSVDLGEANESE